MHVLHSLAVYIDVKSKKYIFHACTLFLSNVYAWKIKRIKFHAYTSIAKNIFRTVPSTQNAEK